MKVIVTMTSWKGRINFLARSIYSFMKTQTVKPDEFYVWLAEEEFPQKENELPEDLMLVCKYFNIKICWCKYNDYAFKRWYVYPEHNEDLVISIDDDMDYFNTLIEDCKNEVAKNKTPHIIHYSSCGGIISIPSGIGYVITNTYNGPHPANYFFGQCAFAPNTFPMEIMNEENLKLKRKICRKTDEGWIHPFTIKHNIPIVFLPPKFRKEHQEMQHGALRDNLHFTQVKINGRSYKKADVYRFMVIRSSKELTDAWLKYFPNYNMDEFRETDETLLSYLE